jgi:HAD superfamily hydrolase (TIGR01459 family)
VKQSVAIAPSPPSGPSRERESGPAFLERFSTLAPGYDALLCDVWGVVHNGLASSTHAVDALARFRALGGTVVLISNAPRPGAWVVRQLDRLGVSRAAYDAIVTSGDVTRRHIAARPGETVFHLGPQRDLSIFDGLDLHFGRPDDADYAVCTGLCDDERETPEHYRALLAAMRARALLMLCANPDLVVERGDRLVYCAGALADLYGTLGGEVLYAGKPHRPIYDEALGVVAAVRGRAPALDRVLAIGDSLRTDVNGAASLGVECLFVTTGIHAEELGGRDDPNLDALERLFAAADERPNWVTTKLVW